MAITEGAGNSLYVFNRYRLQPNPPVLTFEKCHSSNLYLLDSLSLFAGSKSRNRFSHYFELPGEGDICNGFYFLCL